MEHVFYFTQIGVNPFGPIDKDEGERCVIGEDVLAVDLPRSAIPLLSPKDRRAGEIHLPGLLDKGAHEGGVMGVVVHTKKRRDPFGWMSGETGR
jgi:hypothetical protein